MFNVLLFPLICAMFMAVNMGGSGTSPAFSAAYGANLIRKEAIPGLFGIFVFLGAIIAGKAVAVTVGKDLVPTDYMTITVSSIVLLSVGLALLFANLLSIPQSTSQATVFALMGPGIYLDVLQTKKLFVEIIPTWFILPVISFFIIYIFGKYIFKPIRKMKFVNKYLKYDHIANHPGLKFFVILGALYVAFSIGSNNVANAAGIISSMILNELQIDGNNSNFVLIMILSTLIIAPCFGIGSSIFGRKVVTSAGKEIVEFGPLGGLAISVVSATLLLLASVTRGIPTSLVQLNTGAILALAVVKIGWRKTFKKKIVERFWLIWIISPIVAFMLSLLLTILADGLGILYYNP